MISTFRFVAIQRITGTTCLSEQKGVKRKYNGLYVFHLTNHEEDSTFGEIWHRGLFIFSLKVYLMKLLNEVGNGCTIGYINTSVGKWALAKKFQEKNTNEQ